jgi:polysaccharide export outer membrane protein
MKLLSRVFVVIFLIAGITGCASSPPNLPEDSAAGMGAGHSVLVESYKMDVMDQVQINVWKNPELSISEPIRPDGKIAMPLIGDIAAAGKTPEELAADIRLELSGYVKNPNVTVILTNLQGHEFLSRIRVTGSVENNMSMPYHQGMTVLDAVLEAGSVNPFADGNSTKLYRRTETGVATYDIRLEDVLIRGDMSTNVLLLPGDVIIVPERLF